MIFIAGMVCGAVVALVVYSCVVASHNADEQTTESKPVSDSLNEEKQRMEQERQRQFDMLMKYTGERQV